MRMFEKLGYKVGLIIQALPYDFRKETDENNLGNINGKFKKILASKMLEK